MNFYDIFTSYNYIYDKEKAEKLLKERQIDIKVLLEKLKNYDICSIAPNPNYENQFYVVIKYKFKTYYPVVIAIKIIKNKKELIIKTAFPNRKLKDLITNC